MSIADEVVPRRAVGVRHAERKLDRLLAAGSRRRDRPGDGRAVRRVDAVEGVADRPRLPVARREVEPLGERLGAGNHAGLEVRLDGQDARPPHDQPQPLLGLPQ
jgi:hypothetical protein